MKYDHWIKMEGNPENHHVLNDLPLKRALWGVKKGSNTKYSYWNNFFLTWSLLTLRWRWWFRRSRCLASIDQNYVTIDFAEFQIFWKWFSKQFRSKIASYHYAGIVDAQMKTCWKNLDNCKNQGFRHVMLRRSRGIHPIELGPVLMEWFAPKIIAKVHLVAKNGPLKVSEIDFLLKYSWFTLKIQGISFCNAIFQGKIDIRGIPVKNPPLETKMLLIRGGFL